MRRSRGDIAGRLYYNAIRTVNSQVLVLELADLGMSTRAIAPVVGAKSHDTVARDIREARQSTQVYDGRTPEPADYERDAIEPAPPATAARTVTGLDGKRYGVQRHRPACPPTTT